MLRGTLRSLRRDEKEIGDMVNINEQFNLQYESVYIITMSQQQPI